MAATTRRHDAWKAARYAAAGVGEYWIVDILARVVTVHRDPREAGYHDVAPHGNGERIPTPVGAPEVEIAALLGPRG